MLIRTETLEAYPVICHSEGDIRFRAGELPLCTSEIPLSTADFPLVARGFRLGEWEVSFCQRGYLRSPVGNSVSVNLFATIQPVKCNLTPTYIELIRFGLF